MSLPPEICRKRIISTKIQYVLLGIIFTFSCQQDIKLSPLVIPDDITGKIVTNNNNELFFCKKHKDVYTIYKYSKDSITLYKSHERDIINPICIQDSVYGLVDNEGDERFTIDNSDLNRKLNIKSLKGLYSSSKSSIIIFVENNNRDLYLYDLDNSHRQKIFTFKTKINGVDFSEKNIIISFDESLYLIDSKTYAIKRLAPGMKGEKLNPFIYNDEVYFANNSLGEFYNIYKVNLDSTYLPEHYYGSSEDIKMPKIYKNRLYFLEIHQSKYLLSYIDEKKVKRRVTNDGVVFSYNFINDKIVFTYSSINIPRSLCEYDLSTNTTRSYSTDKPKTSLTATYITKKPFESHGYKISSTGYPSTRGVILYFRGGGKETDFSPRWDNTLANLANNGYIIYAPNFSSSIGYGKAYTNRTTDQAMLDLLDWKKYILAHHPGLNLYFLSSSSGNLYMEEILKRDGKNVKSSASFFGVYSDRFSPNFNSDLYILGKNDSHIKSKYRLHNIRKNSVFMINKKFIIYDREGHWLRRSSNTKDAIIKIIKHFN